MVLKFVLFLNVYPPLPGQEGWGGGCLQTNCFHLDLFIDETSQFLRVKKSLCLLIQKCLIGRPASFSNEEEVVLVTGRGVDLHLSWEVGARVRLLKHIEGCDLGGDGEKNGQERAAFNDIFF